MTYKKINFVSNLYVETAKKEAEKSSLTMKHGCVIVRNKKIISKGYNKYDLHNQFKMYYSTHAEIDAISKSKSKFFKNCTMYVIRVRSDGSLTDSKPCPICQKVLKKKGILKIFYS